MAAGRDESIPEPGALKVLGDDLERAVAHGGARVCCHLLTVDPPLRLENGLDDVFGARADGQAHLVVGLAPVQALLLQRESTRVRIRRVLLIWNACLLAHVRRRFCYFGMHACLLAHV